MAALHRTDRFGAARLLAAGLVTAHRCLHRLVLALLPRVHRLLQFLLNLKVSRSSLLQFQDLLSSVLACRCSVSLIRVNRGWRGRLLLMRACEVALRRINDDVASFRGDVSPLSSRVVTLVEVSVADVAEPRVASPAIAMDVPKIIESLAGG